MSRFAEVEASHDFKRFLSSPSGKHKGTENLKGEIMKELTLRQYACMWLDDVVRIQV